MKSYILLVIDKSGKFAPVGYWDEKPTVDQCIDAMDKTNNTKANMLLVRIENEYEYTRHYD